MSIRPLPANPVLENSSPIYSATNLKRPRSEMFQEECKVQKTAKKYLSQKPLKKTSDRSYVHFFSTASIRPVIDEPSQCKQPKVYTPISAGDHFLMEACTENLSYLQKIKASLIIAKQMINFIVCNSVHYLTPETLPFFDPDNLTIRIGETGTIDSIFYNGENRESADACGTLFENNGTFKEILFLGQILEKIFQTEDRSSMNPKLVNLINSLTHNFSKIEFQNGSMLAYLTATKEIIQQIYLEDVKQMRALLLSKGYLQPKPPETTVLEENKAHILADVCPLLPVEQRLVVLRTIVSELDKSKKMAGPREFFFYSLQNIQIKSVGNNQWAAEFIYPFSEFLEDSKSLTDPDLNVSFPESMVETLYFLGNILGELFPDLDKQPNELREKTVNLLNSLISADPSFQTIDGLSKIIREVDKLIIGLAIQKNMAKNTDVKNKNSL